VHESPVANHPNLTLVAGWFDGELHVPPSSDDTLTPNAVLVVAGPERELEAVANEVAGTRSQRVSTPSKVVVAGIGEGGTAAVEALPDDVPVVTIDEAAERGPDVVGDVTEPQTFRDAGLDDASALIVTVDDDSTALLTVAIARSLSSEVEILARVTDGEKARAAFRAGADYVLSIQRVSARLVAAEVHGERTVNPTGQIRLIRADAAPFAGESLSDVRRDAERGWNVRERGWTVVGVSRGGAIRTDEGTTIEADDEVLVAGSDDAIQQFERTVDAS